MDDIAKIVDVMVKKYPSAREMIAPMLDVVSIGATSDVIASSGVTGATRVVLQQVPTVMASRSVQRIAKRIDVPKQRRRGKRRERRWF